MNLLNFQNQQKFYQDMPQTPGLLYTSAAIQHQLPVQPINIPTTPLHIHGDYAEVASPQYQFQSQQILPNVEKSINRSHRSRKNRRINNIVNHYKSRSRSRSRRVNNRNTNIDQMSNQFSRINFQGDQIKVRKPPRSVRIRSSQPKRQQQPRRGKCIQAGAFKEQNLAQRIIQEAPKPAKPNKPIVERKPSIQQIDPNDPYALIRENQNIQNDDILCDICLGDDDEEGDEIVICELCNAATHQTCYGGAIKNRLPKINEPWYCERCEHLLKNNQLQCTEIKCFLCPEIHGMIKPINMQKNKWAHVVCVNWTPEIWFTNDLKMTISGNVPESRFKLRCDKCHKNQGSCVQCDFKNCSRSYHVRCAIKGKLIWDWEKMQEQLGNPQNNVSTPIFCFVHSAQGQNIYKQTGESGLTCIRKRTHSAPAKPAQNKAARSPPVKKVAKKIIKKKNRGNKKDGSRRPPNSRVKNPGIHKKHAQMKAASNLPINLQKNTQLNEMLQNPNFTSQFASFCQQYNSPQSMAQNAGKQSKRVQKGSAGKKKPVKKGRTLGGKGKKAAATKKKPVPAKKAAPFTQANKQPLQHITKQEVQQMMVIEQPNLQTHSSYFGSQLQPIESLIPAHLQQQQYQPQFA